MRIFYRRPLCIGCAVFMLALLLTAECGLTIKITLAAASAFVFALSLLLPGKIFKKRLSVKNRYGVIDKKLVVATVSFMLLLAMLVSLFFFSVYFDKAEKCVSECAEVEAIIVKEKFKSVYKTTYEVKVTGIDSRKMYFGAILEFNSEADLKPCDKVKVKGAVMQIKDYLDDPAYEKLYLSDGIFMAVNCENSSDCVLADTVWLPQVFFKNINGNVSDYLTEKVGGEAAALSSALLLGNDDLLSASTVRDFRRSGVSHVLALSGLHVAIITAFLDYAFIQMHFQKKFRSAIMFTIMLAYLFLTGFAPSTVRAVLMLGMVYLSYFIRVDSDPLTSLFVAVTVIILFSPTSVYDIGLWLSFLSVFGLLALMPPLNEAVSAFLKPLRKIRLLYRLIKYVILSLAVTLSVNTAIILVTWRYFGYFSIVTPLANLFVPLLATVMLATCLIFLIFGWIHPVGLVLAKAVGLIGDLMLYSTGKLSELPHIIVSLRYDFATVIIFSFTVVMILCLLSDLGKKKYLITLVPLAAVALFFGCFFLRTSLNSDILETSYVRNGESEMLALSSSNRYAVIDVSNGAYTNLKAAYSAINQMHGYEIDSYVITHYHSASVTSLKKLSENTFIRKLYLPIPQNEDEENAAKRIASVFDGLSTKVIIFGENDEIEIIGGATFRLNAKEYIKRSTHPIVSFDLRFSDSELLYLGESTVEIKERLNIDGEYNCIIFGTHGPIEKKNYSFPAKVAEGGVAIFSTNEIFGFIDLDEEEYIGHLRFCDVYRDVEDVFLRLKK